MVDAGIVDEDIQTAEGRHGLGNQAIGKAGIGDVARDESRPEFLGERRTGCLIASRQHQLRALRRHFSGDGATQTRGSPGHQASLPV